MAYPTINHVDKEHQDGTPLLEIKCFDINKPFEVYYKGEKVLVSKLLLQAGSSGKMHDRSFNLVILNLDSGTFKTVGESTPEANDYGKNHFGVSANVEDIQYDIFVKKMEKALYEVTRSVGRRSGLI